MHKNLKPLEQFICDICGKIIETPDDGYIVWDKDANNKEYGFKIIHRDCDDGSCKLSSELEDFIGKDGLNNLLGHLSQGTLKIKTSGDDYKEIVSVESTDAFVDLFRRLQIPDYEEARQYFDDYNVQDKYHECHETAPYSEESLKDIIKSPQN
jgi:hypothetical protein